MKRIPIAFWILVFLYGLFLISLTLSQGHLPERVATHFNRVGQADGWMSRAAHLRFTLILGTVTPVFVLGVVYLARFLPNTLINIPRREYWLAPERRDETLAHLFRHSLWLACLDVGFIAGIQGLLVAANQSPEASLSNIGMLCLTGITLILLGLWIFILVRHFLRTR